MSAFQVSETTINVIATAYAELHDFVDRQAVANALALQNERSLEARYGLEPTRTTVQYKPIAAADPVELLTRCRCYQYQACESRDWEKTPAYRVVQQVLTTLEKQGVTGLSQQHWE